MTRLFRFSVLAAVLALLALAGCEAPPPAAPAPAAVDTLTVVVDLSEQTLTATRTYVAERKTIGWTTPVSTGRRGYETPTGSFHPFFLSKNHKSSLYEDAPMPFAVFFNADVAIHGTYEQTLLGRPVSHGCVRVHTAFAETFFQQVLEVGKANTTITVQD